MGRITVYDKIVIKNPKKKDGIDETHESPFRPTRLRDCLAMEFI